MGGRKTVLLFCYVKCVLIPQLILANSLPINLKLILFLYRPTAKTDKYLKVFVNTFYGSVFVLKYFFFDYSNAYFKYLNKYRYPYLYLNTF